MEGRRAAERIEIELTSNVESHDRWRDRQQAESLSGDDATIVVGLPDTQTDPTGSDQRRLFVTAMIVGVLALVLGWLIGRAGGTDEVATTGAKTPSTTDAVVQTLLPGETLPTAATTTTRPRRTTTSTTLAPPSRTLVDVDPRLDGIELTLVGIERDNVLVELELGSRILARRELGRIGAEPGGLFVGDDWIVVQDMGGARTAVVRDDGTVERVALGEGWDLLWRRGTDRFWRPDYPENWNGQPRYVEIDLTGEPTGATIELPFDMWAWRTSPEGGLLIEVIGKLYSVDESSIEYVGSGELLGLSPDVAVTRDCDEQLRCDVFVTDRQTGDLRPLGIDAFGQVMSIEAMFGWGIHTGESVAPDGSMCAVIVRSGEAMHLALLDLDSGAIVELAADPFMTFLVWSSDARFAFFLDGDGSFGPWAHGGGDLTVYDRLSGEVFPVLSEPVEWERLAARSS